MTVNAVKGSEAVLFIGGQPDSGGQRVCFESLAPNGPFENRIDDSDRSICGGSLPMANRVVPGLIVPRVTIRCRPTFLEMNDIYLPWMGFTESSDVFTWTATAQTNEVVIGYGGAKSVTITGAVISNARFAAQRGGLPALLTYTIIGTGLTVGDPVDTDDYGSLLSSVVIPFTGAAELDIGNGTEADYDINRCVVVTDNHSVPIINADRTPSEITTGGRNTTHFGFGSNASTDAWTLNETIRSNPTDVSATWTLTYGGNTLAWKFPALDEPTSIPPINGRDDDIDFPHYMKAYRATTGTPPADEYRAELTTA